MNRQLLELCVEYVKCYQILDCLLCLNGIDAERLKLFRLTQERCKRLESEMEQCIVENDLLNTVNEAIE